MLRACLQAFEPSGGNHRFVRRQLPVQRRYSLRWRVEASLQFAELVRFADAGWQFAHLKLGLGAQKAAQEGVNVLEVGAA